MQLGDGGEGGRDWETENRGQEQRLQVSSLPLPLAFVLLVIFLAVS